MRNEQRENIDICRIQSTEDSIKQNTTQHFLLNHTKIYIILIHHIYYLLDFQIMNVDHASYFIWKVVGALSTCLLLRTEPTVHSMAFFQRTNSVFQMHCKSIRNFRRVSPSRHLYVLIKLFVLFKNQQGYYINYIFVHWASERIKKDNTHKRNKSFYMMNLSGN